MLSSDIIPVLQRSLKGRPLMDTPYAGGVLVQQLQELSRMHESRATVPTLKSLKLASLNPGRTGFSKLGSDELLFWRLWAVALNLEALGVHLCVVPGARFPPGAALPEAFPYAFRGTRSSHWGAVGVFIALELDELVFEIEGVGSERWVWLGVPASGSLLVVCAFYGPPGGDAGVWSSITREYVELKRSFPDARFVLLGDAMCTCLMLDHAALL